MPGRPFEWRLIAWIGVAILSTYCLFWAGAWLATYYVEFRVWALIPAFTVVAVWIVVAIRDSTWRPRTVLMPAFIAGSTALVLATILSRQPRVSVEYLALATLLASLYLLLQRLMASAYFRPRMLSFAMIASLLLGLAYVVAVVVHWIPWWESVGQLVAPPLRPQFEGLTLGNPSAVMTASVLLTAPAVAVLMGGSRAHRAGAFGLVALAAVVTLLSGSRAGWLAIAISVLVVAVLSLRPPTRRAAIVRIGRPRAGLLVVGPLAAVAAVMALVAAPGFLLRTGAGGEAVRAGYWAAAVRMFEESPLVGTGPGTWVSQRIAYTLNTETDYYIPHAHNIYVQTLAELGVIGVLAGAVVALVLIRLLAGAINNADRARADGLGRALLNPVLRYPPSARLLCQLARDPVCLCRANRMARRYGATRYQPAPDSSEPAWFRCAYVDAMGTARRWPCRGCRAGRFRGVSGLVGAWRIALQRRRGHAPGQRSNGGCRTIALGGRA